MSTINGKACVANGRNLYIDTKNFDNPDIWSYYGRWQKSADKFNGLTVMEANTDWFGLGQDVQVKKGEVYTFSLYARYESGTGNSTMYFIPTGSTVLLSQTSATFSLNETWQRISATFSVNADGVIHPRIERTADNTNTLMIAGLKLERGSKATDYSPVPVDKVFSNGKQVYGRNLYTDTQNFDNLTSSWFGYGGWTKTTDTYKGLAVVQKNKDWGGVSQYIQVEKGDILTYSVYAKYVSGTGKSNIYWKLNNNYEGSYSGATVNQTVTWITITDSWQRISGTAIATSDGYLRPRLEKAGGTNTLQIAGIKVEKGSTATPWTPALEDVSDYSRNLLTGTGSHTVTGTGAFTADSLSNETTDDLLTLFKGLEGQTVTVSVDYNYSGFVAGSKTSRLGWETQINAGTPAYYGAWYSPNYSHNDSGSGRISYTFVVPINITSVGGSKGYIQFSGSGTGTLSHLKLEIGSVATPWSLAPEDVSK